MRKYLLAAAGIVLVAGSGAAMAQMPPPGGPEAGSGAGAEQRHERWGMMHHHRPERDGAAFFRFRRGDAEMDIKCPAMENVQACVAAAGSLMDKVSGMQQPKAQ